MRAFLTAAVLAIAATLPGPALAQKAGSYADDLARVYEATQFIQAVREGCDAAVPATRADNAAAYSAWRKRHQALLDELEHRFIALIRRASVDQKDSSRNVGKYEGDALRHVEELKSQFLAQSRGEIGRQCAGYPGYLASRDADLPSRYAAELQSIRRRKP